MKKTIIVMLLFLSFPVSSYAIDKVSNARVYFVDSLQVPCGKTYVLNPDIRGCDVYKTNSIYIKNEKYFTGSEAHKNSEYMEFTLYHEFGHHLFKLNFPKRLFANEEYMADAFALYVLVQKRPAEYSVLASEFLTSDQYDYFKSKLSVKEYDRLVKLKIGVSFNPL